MSKHIVAFCVLLLIGAAEADASTFFVDDTAMSVTITAPIRDMIFHRRKKEEYPAVLKFENSAGNTVELNIRIAARGNSRLDACDFPPLRLILDKGTAAGTVFDGQRKIKLVNRCRAGKNAADWLLAEYGIYRAYNVITENSFRVRRLEVTYVDSEHAGWERQRTAFIIESIKDAAARLRRDAIRPPTVSAEQFNQVEMASNSLFQFLIGNTDYAVKRGPKGEGCCHNGRVLSTPGSQEDWIVLPYDFDQSGLVNADYALPAEAFRIRRVTTRIYRGFCWNNDELIDAIALFNDKREQILAALLPENLSKSKSGRVERYVNSFYNTINDSKKMQKQLQNKCRGPDSLPVRASRTKSQGT